MSLATLVSNQPPYRDHARSLNSTLIVTPASITHQWLEEIHKHVITGAKGRSSGIGISMRYSNKTISLHPDPVSYLASHDIVVTTYAEVLGSYPKCKPPIELQTAQEKDAWWRNHYFANRGWLHQMKWRRIILDEATSIKNHLSWSSKACIQLTGDFYWVISGTPAMNSLAEFYSYFKFLRVPSVGSYKVFRRNFINDTSQGSERLQTFLRPFMLRRTHESTMFGAKLLNLPEPTRFTLTVHFDQLESQIYDVVRRRFILMINSFARAGELRKKYSHILTLLLRLRQLASHPLLIQDSLRDLLKPEDFEELNKITDIEVPAHKDQHALIKHLRRMLKNPKGLAVLEQSSSEASPDSKDANGRFTSSSQTLQSSQHTPYAPNQEKTSDSNAESEQKSQHSQPQEPFQQQESSQQSESVLKKQWEQVSVGGTFGVRTDLAKYIQSFKDEIGNLENEDHIRCGKCGKRPKDLHLTSCQHTYCNECLMEMSHETQEGNMKCLVCSEAFTGMQILTAGANSKGIQRGGVSHAPSTASTRQSTAQPAKKKTYRPSPRECVEKWVDAKGNMVPSAKTSAIKSQLLNWLDEKPTPKIVVYSQFRTMIMILRKMCALEGWECIEFHGSMSADARNKAIKRFESDPRINVMLASLKTGGVGLNLSFASRVLVVDLWWNSAVEEQAFCRTYRRGQQRETFLTRLAVQETIDMDIVKMQERKEKEIDSVIAAKAKKMSAQELMALFGPVSTGNHADGTEFIYVDPTKGRSMDREIEEDEEMQFN